MGVLVVALNVEGNYIELYNFMDDGDCYIGEYLSLV